MKKILYAQILIIALLSILLVVSICTLEKPDVPAVQTDVQLEEPSAKTEPQEQQAPQSTTEPQEETEPEETTQPEEPTAPLWTYDPGDRELLAKQYFVYDVEFGVFLIDSGNGSRVYPASITKLFTCYVAMEYLEPDTVLTVGDELDMVAWGSSVAGLVKGDKISVAQLTEAMLLPSGNDAAYVLAVNAGRIICGDPNAGVYYAVNAFMEKMNQFAREIGMTSTHFSNPDGIHDDNHYMSFNDLALLGAFSLENDTIMNMAKIARDQVEFDYVADRPAPTDPEAPGVGEWKNTNQLIDPESEYYCPYATGLKTGQTPYAGSCLLSAFHYEGRNLIIGVFGCPETVDRFPDTLQLFTQALE